MILGAGVFVYRANKRAHDAQLAQTQLELQNKELLEAQLTQQVQAQGQEIDFLRTGWYVQESDLNLEVKVAKGAEGEVWRGTMKGYEGLVAIKKSNPWLAEESG